MRAKEQLKQFLRHAMTTPDVPYTFELMCTPNDAHTYVHRMRVELTRFRAHIRNAGKQIIPFKMLLRSVEQDELGNCHVTLSYHLDIDGQLSEDISEIFAAVAVDRDTLDYKAARGLPPEPRIPTQPKPIPVIRMTPMEPPSPELAAVKEIFHDVT
jgi:hypothetical protein